MTQYKFWNKSNREVLYGLDKPTGGYFFTEFFTDEEMEEGRSNETKQNESGLTLTELHNALWDEYKFLVSDDTLASDYLIDPYPTPLQFNINKMFGRDLLNMLEKTKNNLVENYGISA